MIRKTFAFYVDLHALGKFSSYFFTLVLFEATLGYVHEQISFEIQSPFPIFHFKKYSPMSLMDSPTIWQIILSFFYFTLSPQLFFQNLWRQIKNE